MEFTAYDFLDFLDTGIDAEDHMDDRTELPSTEKDKRRGVRRKKDFAKAFSRKKLSKSILGVSEGRFEKHKLSTHIYSKNAPVDPHPWTKTNAAKKYSGYRGQAENLSAKDMRKIESMAQAEKEYRLGLGIEPDDDGPWFSNMKSAIDHAMKEYEKEMKVCA